MVMVTASIQTKPNFEPTNDHLSSVPPWFSSLHLARNRNLSGLSGLLTKEVAMETGEWWYERRNFLSKVITSTCTSTSANLKCKSADLEYVVVRVVTSFQCTSLVRGQREV